MWKKPSVLLTALMCLCFSTAALADWTDWLDRDAPSGQGDFETLNDFRATGAVPCAKPDLIECRIAGGGVDWSETGEVYSCSPSRGGVCVNAKQPGGTQCSDYEVRFFCEYAPPTLSATSKTEFGCGRMTSIRTEVTIDIAGGAEPFACYGPAGAAIQVSGDQCVAIGLTPGKAQFLVVDGYSPPAVIDVDVRDVIDAAVSATAATDCTAADGSATVSASGFNGPFTYRWNTDPEQSGPMATALRAGTYSVIVTDTQGCFRVVEVNVGC